MDSKTLGAIINTLNKIPTWSKEYMSMMIGCINLLEEEYKRRLQEEQNGKNHPAE